MKKDAVRETGGAGAWTGVACMFLFAGVAIYVAAQHIACSFGYWCK